MKIDIKPMPTLAGDVDAEQSDSVHSLDKEHARLVLLAEVEIGLNQILAGQRLSFADLNALLSV